MRVTREQPTAAVRFGDAFLAFLPFLAPELVGQPGGLVGRDFFERGVQFLNAPGQDGFVPGKDRVERRVASDTLERDVWNGFAGKSPWLRAAVFQPSAFWIATHVLGIEIAQFVVWEASRKKSLLGERKRDAAGVNGDPTASSLLGDKSGRAAATSRVQNQVAGICGH